MSVAHQMVSAELTSPSSPRASAEFYGRPNATTNFTIRNLSVLAYAQGFTLWHYKSTDALLVTCGAGYFDLASDMLATGDMVLISSRDGGTVAFVAKADGIVLLAPMSAVQS